YAGDGRGPTQETFLQAWRRLATFERRASLRVWLHRIDRREFLQVLGSQRPQAAWEAVGEVVAAPDVDWLDAVELRELIRKLPPPLFRRFAVILEITRRSPAPRVPGLARVTGERRTARRPAAQCRAVFGRRSVRYPGPSAPARPC